MDGWRHRMSVSLRDLTLPSIIFCYQFMSVVANVTLPFYIQALTPGEPGLALRWTGWMLGIVPLMAILTTPTWMRWADRSPRAFYVLSQGLQGGCYLVTAWARTLPELFGSRVLLGASGSAQSLALVIVGRSGGPHVRWTVSAIQSGTTLATALAPIGAAVIAAVFGLRAAFMAAGLVMWCCGAAVWFSVGAVSPPVAQAQTPSMALWRETGVACLLVFVGFTHVYLLTAILPQIVSALGVEPARALAVAGWVLAASGVALAVGSMATGPLTNRLGERRTLLGCLLAASVCLLGLRVAADPLTFGVIRALETLCVAPVMVLATTRAAQSGSSQAIGFVNSSRVAAGAAGPLLATYLLIGHPVSTVFTVIAVASLACLPVLLIRWPSPAPRPTPARPS